VGRRRGKRDGTVIIGGKHGDGIVDGRIRTAACEEEGRTWVSWNLPFASPSFVAERAFSCSFRSQGNIPVSQRDRSASLLSQRSRSRFVFLPSKSTRLSLFAHSSTPSSLTSDHLFSQTFFACYRRFSRPQDVIALFVSEFQLLEGKKLAGVYAQLKSV